jgi:sucrose-6-phosphate hydrolase SacC (GH32 family)
MKIIKLILIAIIFSFGCFFPGLKSQKLANKPLFRDTVFDGAADPTVIWNKNEKKWFMFYTNRRANKADTALNDVSWVHGTPIGIAESSDEGATWKYRGMANIQYGNDSTTFWAPEVIFYKGIYHMYLTIVPGIYKDWKHPRTINHFTSKNLIDWKFESELNLANNKVIDACVIHLPDGNWRLWYNNEKDGKSIFYADSPDLYHWTDKGKIKSDTRERGEGPKVFRWKNKYFMIIDEWKGLGAYSSDDLINWTRQQDRILDKPGLGKEDNIIGHHADVVVNEGKAYIFYFTHPGKAISELKNNPVEQARSLIQIAELEYFNGQIQCDRDKQVYIKLKGK